MGQSEIFNLLKQRRLSGDTEYYSAEQIYKMLKDQDEGRTISSITVSIQKLRLYGYLDIKIKNFYRKHNKSNCIYSAYRLKEQYL